MLSQWRKRSSISNKSTKLAQCKLVAMSGHLAIAREQQPAWEWSQIRKSCAERWREREILDDTIYMLLMHLSMLGAKAAIGLLATESSFCVKGMCVCVPWPLAWTAMKPIPIFWGVVCFKVLTQFAPLQVQTALLTSVWLRSQLHIVCGSLFSKCGAVSAPAGFCLKLLF